MLGTEAPLIGLIGPIGAGKSTVAGWLRDRGAVVVDADQLSRTLMAPGTAVTASIIARFGTQFRRPDGSLDREALGRLVFSDQEELSALESIVHPAISVLLERTILEADQRQPPAIVLEAIKLVEAGYGPWCNEVWLVLCDPKAQLERLVGRGMSEADARQRMAAQDGSMAVWRSAADRVIRSDSTPTQVEEAVDRAFRRLLAVRR
jgi:dephospho-CoA kinase